MDIVKDQGIFAHHPVHKGCLWGEWHNRGDVVKEKLSLFTLRAWIAWDSLKTEPEVEFTG